MASVTIDGIDETLAQRLREQAAVHGRSIEAEAREILSTALVKAMPAAAKTEGVPGNLADAIRAIVEPLGGIELEPFPRQPIPDPPTFE